MCAFVQSDEISIFITDIEKIETSAWFDNSIQKMVSISASMATAKFNELRTLRYVYDVEERLGYRVLDKTLNLAMFDSRVFQLPTKTEVENYFIWRQQDTVKNSISSVAQSLYSHKELHGKNGNQKQEMIFQKGINWNDYDPKLKRGRMITKEVYEKEPEVFRSRWISVAPPTFTEDRVYLDNLIPDRDWRSKEIKSLNLNTLSNDDKQELLLTIKREIEVFNNIHSSIKKDL